jgi:hypothetical protein
MLKLAYIKVSYSTEFIVKKGLNFAICFKKNVCTEKAESFSLSDERVRLYTKRGATINR